MSISLTQFDGVIDVKKHTPTGNDDASTGGVFRNDVSETERQDPDRYTYSEVRALGNGSERIFARSGDGRIPFDKFPHITQVEKTVLYGSRNRNRLGNA
jgi:hypothetical protein